MRMWHYELLPYLPDRQFKGQLRELVAIMRTWRDEGRTNHLLINNIMDYPKSELTGYFNIYCLEYFNRYNKFVNNKYVKEFQNFAIDYKYHGVLNYPLYENLHNKKYLRICMANLYEKYIANGVSKISDDEWETLLNGYKKITGEEYQI